MNQTVPTPPVEHLRFSEVHRFLEQKVTNNVCPSCSAHVWTAQYGRLTDDPDVIFTALSMPMSAPFNAQIHQKSEMVAFIPFARPVLPLVCGNCGFIRSFDLAFIRKWLNDNPKAGEVAG